MMIIAFTYTSPNPSYIGGEKDKINSSPNIGEVRRGMSEAYQCFL